MEMDEGREFCGGGSHAGLVGAGRGLYDLISAWPRNLATQQPVIEPQQYLDAAQVRNLENSVKDRVEEAMSGMHGMNRPLHTKLDFLNLI